MNLETGFTAVMQRLQALLPGSIQTAEVLAAVTKPQQQAGATKRAAVVKVCMMAAEDALKVAGITLPAGGALESAVGGLVDAAVGVMNAWKPKGSNAGAPKESPAPAGSAIETPGPAPSPATTRPEVADPTAPAAAAADLEGWSPAAIAATLETDVRIKAGVIERDGVRYVWDEMSKAWATPGR